MLETERLLLRKWKESDAESLFEYASDPAVGPIAGWPPHKSVEESRAVIANVLNGPECYAICEKGKERAIGAVGLQLNGRTVMTECELGYWLGRPFWGRGYDGGGRRAYTPRIRRARNGGYLVQLLRRKPEIEKSSGKARVRISHHPHGRPRSFDARGAGRAYKCIDQSPLGGNTNVKAAEGCG